MKQETKKSGYDQRIDSLNRELVLLDETTKSLECKLTKVLDNPSPTEQDDKLRNQPGVQIEADLEDIKNKIVFQWEYIENIINRCVL